MVTGAEIAVGCYSGWSEVPVANSSRQGKQERFSINIDVYRSAGSGDAQDFADFDHVAAFGVGLAQRFQRHAVLLGDGA